MVQAKTVTVKVVDQNGNPLQGIKTTSFPRQVWFTGGSNALGSSCSSQRAWELQLRGRDLYSYFKNRSKKYSGETDKEGVAHLTDMPPGWRHIFATHDDWEMQKKADSPFSQPVRTVKVGSEAHEFTFKMFPKGAVPKN